jgi:hypothetical protein
LQYRASPQVARDRFGLRHDIAPPDRIQKQSAGLLHALCAGLLTRISEPQSMTVCQALRVDTAVVDQHCSLGCGCIRRWPDQPDIDLNPVALREQRQTAGTQGAVRVVDLMKIPDAVGLAA